MPDDSWLTLSAAATLLGVHASTLRLWADQGDIASTRTAGGHRRFRRADVEAFAAVRQEARTIGASTSQIIAENALGRARMQMAEGRLRSETWYLELDDARRARFRDAGRRLLGVLVRYLSGEDPVALDEGAELGRVYNRLGYEANLPLHERVRVFLMFSGFLYQSVIDQYRSTGQRGASQWATLHARTQELTNAALLALIADAEVER